MGTSVRPTGSPKWRRLLRIIAPLGVAALACYGDAPTGPKDGAGVLGEWVAYEGIERPYVLHLPPSYDPAQPAPLLILLHGASDTGAGFQGRIGLDSTADAAGLITVYPDALGGFWWSSTDVGFTRTLIGHLTDDLAIDPNRIYAAGFSRGASLTFSLACRLASQLAAVATVGATLESQTAASCSPSRPIPIVLVHGTEDTAFPWDGLYGSAQLMSMPLTLDVWAEINRCASDPQVEWLLDSWEDGTRVWSEHYADCGAGAELKLFGIEGGGHTWPSAPGPFPDWTGTVSREIGSAEIVEFLTRHSLGG
jgi:polyhydroxybutyrate depolymerase